MSIVKQIKENNLTDATASIHEALAEIRQHKLMEFKKQIAKERFGGLDEASYGGSRNSFTRHNPVRDDPDKVMAAAKERQEMEAKEAAEKKRRFLEAKKKANEVKEEAIQEVSKGLLKRYLKASDSKAGNEKSPKEFRNRIQGHNLAQKKLGMKPKKLGKAKIMAKEDTIQEVSRALLSRYRAKADDQVDRERFRGNKAKVMKRTMGVGKANQKLYPDGKAKVKATD